MNKIWLLLIIILSLFIAYDTSGVELTTVKVADGFSDPLYVTSPPGDPTRLFVVEQNTARIKIIKNGTVLAMPFLDIDSKAGSGGERGLLGFAFHPNYTNNGYFYVNYTDNSGNSVIARYRVSGNPDIADPNSETIMMTVAQPFGNHNGGMLTFSPNDGHLYIGIGDGGSANDPGNRAQDTIEALGKIHRIDVGNGDIFSAPADNPFTGDPGALDSIWALGLRNPWRFSFDRLNGDLYIADVGQGAREEVDIQGGDSAGGENYGWRCMEGLLCTGLSGCICNSADLTPPVHDYTHADGNCSVTGGYVYRGPEIPELDGTYFFADFCTGRIWSFVWQGNNITQFQERTGELQPESGETINNVTSFGEDERGEIYIVDRDGEIFKIAQKIDVIPAPTPTPVPPGEDPVLSGFEPNQPGTTNTLTVINAPPGARVDFNYSTSAGSTSIRRGVCSGQSYDLSRPRSLGTSTANSSGTATLNVSLSRRSGGRTYYLQASVETSSSCVITNMVKQVIGSSGGGGNDDPDRGERRPSRKRRRR